MTEDFKNILIKRIIANGMTTKQLTDAVCWVLDHKRWDTFQIADIISWDKTVKLYNYNQYTEKPAGKTMIDLGNGQPAWVDTSELAAKGLQVKNKKIEILR